MAAPCCLSAVAHNNNSAKGSVPSLQAPSIAAPTTVRVTVGAGHCVFCPVRRRPAVQSLAALTATTKRLFSMTHVLRSSAFCRLCTRSAHGPKRISFFPAIRKTALRRHYTVNSQGMLQTCTCAPVATSPYDYTNTRRYERSHQHRKRTGSCRTIFPGYKNWQSAVRLRSSCAHTRSEYRLCR